MVKVDIRSRQWGKNEKQASDGGDDIGNDSVERTNNGENLWESIKKLAG